jgi:hypothetical protein
VRLRPLTEAECYARCYGDVRSDQVVVLRQAPVGDDPPARAPASGRRAEVREEAA